MRRNLISLFAALALLAAPAVAAAEEATKSYPDCGREPTDAEVAAAKGAFQAGNASFNEADYTRAIDYWEDAYRRDCTANPLLLNLARAYELAGRKRQAVVSLETFLAREPSTGEKDQINRRIDVLKKKIAEEDAVAATAAPPPAAVGATDAPPAIASPAAADASPQSAKRSPGPWVVVGVGGAVAIAGTVGALVNAKKVKEADAECPTRNGCTDQTAKKGNDARTRVNVSAAVAGVGLLAVAGGVVWYFVDRAKVTRENSSSPAAARLTPLLGPNFAGLDLSGTF